jgi:hypothetical protein
MNKSLIEKPKVSNIQQKAAHKKQNTITNYSVFKFLTSPRSTKNNYKMPSTRLEVINLNKEHNLRRKNKGRKLFGYSVAGDTPVPSKKKSIKRDKEIKHNEICKYLFGDFGSKHYL